MICCRAKRGIQVAHFGFQAIRIEDHLALRPFSVLFFERFAFLESHWDSRLVLHQTTDVVFFIIKKQELVDRHQAAGQSP